MMQTRAVHFTIGGIISMQFPLQAQFHPQPTIRYIKETDSETRHHSSPENSLVSTKQNHLQRNHDRKGTGFRISSASVYLLLCECLVSFEMCGANEF